MNLKPQYILLESLKMDKKLRELCIIRMEGAMKVHLKMICVKEKDIICMLMVKATLKADFAKT